MKFTLEALYLLHMYNEYSDDLAFLPLESEDGLNRKDLLRKTISKGYQDLQDMGLIIDQSVTEDCVRFGQYLRDYHQSSYHYSIDQTYFVAPEVDEYKRMSVVLHRLDDGSYFLDRITSVILWGYIQEGHQILHHLDDKVKDYMHFDWEPYSAFRTVMKFGNSDALRLTIMEYGNVQEDVVYMDLEGTLYEYSIPRQERRSIDSQDMVTMLMKKGKVRL